jgi:DNA-binding transcriptional ArsR family regulator
MTSGPPSTGDSAGVSPDPTSPGDESAFPPAPLSRFTTAPFHGSDEAGLNPVGFHASEDTVEPDGRFGDDSPEMEFGKDDAPVVPLVPERDVITLDDPRAIRALAHPARIAAVDHLFAGEVLTATECARIADISPSAMSYHLRALERWGLIVRAEATGDGRERPWRSAARRIHVGGGSGVSAKAAQDQLLTSLIDLLRADLTRGLALVERKPDPYPLLDIAVLAATMTRSEVENLMQQVEGLVQPYVARAECPEGAHGYHLYGAVLPLEGQDEGSTPRR